MSFALKSTEAGARVGGKGVNNLRFADDIDLVAEDEEQLQEVTDEVLPDIRSSFAHSYMHSA